MARKFVDNAITVFTLAEARRTLTALQSSDIITPLLNKFIRIPGKLFAVSDNGVFGFTTATITASRGSEVVDVFCIFYGKQPRLELAEFGEIIWIEGSLKEVEAQHVKLDNCVLLDTQTALTLAATRSSAPSIVSVGQEILDAARNAAPVESPVPRPVRQPVEPVMPPMPRLKPLAAGEMRRFAQLYIELWQNAAVEGKALTAVRATYPNNSIGRDAFYKIFRELRGPGKRGNPAFRGQ